MRSPSNKKGSMLRPRTVADWSTPTKTPYLVPVRAAPRVCPHRLPGQAPESSEASRRDRGQKCRNPLHDIPSSLDIILTFPSETHVKASRRSAPIHPVREKPLGALKVLRS